MGMQKNMIFLTSTVFCLRGSHGSFALCRFLSVDESPAAGPTLYRFVETNVGHICHVLTAVKWGRTLVEGCRDRYRSITFLPAMTTGIFIAPKGYGGVGTRLELNICGLLFFLAY